MVIVSDTTAITNLYQIKLLLIIKQLYGQIMIPRGVYEELSRFSNQKSIVDNTGWIKVVDIKNTELLKELLTILDLGEAEAITLAKETKSDLLIIDEHKGRVIAKQHGLRIIGLLGILTTAKKKGLIPTIRPYIEELIDKANFRINPRLLHDVLKSVGEV